MDIPVFHVVQNQSFRKIKHNADFRLSDFDSAQLVKDTVSPRAIPV